MKPLTYVVVSCLLLGTPAWAKHWHDDGDHWNKHWKHHDNGDERDFDHHADGCHFQPRDVRVIGEYYAPRYRSLPPGLEKKFYRTGRLPPGWEKRMEPLPVVVERQLTPLPAGYQRGFIDGHAVVYIPRTQVVVDVFATFGLGRR
jgi:hypothetical protein